jgi:HK97 family phage prohead protease
MSNRITGFAALYGVETVIAGAFRERLAAGCFSKSLSGDIVALLAHDHGRVLGRTSSGTLTVKDTRVGLDFALEADPSTPSGQEALGTVGRQDVKGCSFGMIVLAEEWRDDGQDLPLRIITEAEIYEITLTAFPAYETTSAAVLRADNRSAAARRAEDAMKARGITI